MHIAHEILIYCIMHNAHSNIYCNNMIYTCPTNNNAVHQYTQQQHDMYAHIQVHHNTQSSHAHIYKYILTCTTVHV